MNVPSQASVRQPKEKMKPIKFLGAALLVAGILALVYGGFSYTKETTAVKVGPIELSVKDKESVNIPVWAGIAAVVAGGILLAFGGKKG
jgi:drug/metabolite transporter (DMT)-like permease